MKHIKFLRKLNFPGGDKALKKIYDSMGWKEKSQFIEYAKKQYAQKESKENNNSKLR